MFRVEKLGGWGGRIPCTPMKSIKFRRSGGSLGRFLGPLYFAGYTGWRFESLSAESSYRG